MIGKGVSSRLNQSFDNRWQSAPLLNHVTRLELTQQIHFIFKQCFLNKFGVHFPNMAKTLVASKIPKVTFAVTFTHHTCDLTQPLVKKNSSFMPCEGKISEIETVSIFCLLASDRCTSLGTIWMAMMCSLSLTLLIC
jgi:hypothetical protein